MGFRILLCMVLSGAVVATGCGDDDGGTDAGGGDDGGGGNPDDDLPAAQVGPENDLANIADADRLKATLALSGFEASIQTVHGADSQWHRVRLGPYPSLQTVEAARSRLKQANASVQAVVVKETL